MIDWDRVSSLKTELGESDFEEVVELFLAEVDETITRLNTAELEENLHFLKSSALNLGFQSFAKLCEAGERKSAQGDSVSVDLREIVVSYSESKHAFIAGLHNTSI